MQLSDARRISNDLVLCFSASRDKLLAAKKTFLDIPPGNLSPRDQNSVTRIEKAILVDEMRQADLLHRSTQAAPHQPDLEREILGDPAYKVFNEILAAPAINVLLEIKHELQLRPWSYTFIEIEILYFAIEMRRTCNSRRHAKRRAKYLAETLLFCPDFIKKRYTIEQNAILSLIGHSYNLDSACEISLDWLASRSGLSCNQAGEAILAAASGRKDQKIIGIICGEISGHTDMPLRLSIESSYWKNYLDSLPTVIPMPPALSADSEPE